MHISIDDLKKDIIKRYPDACLGGDFGIVDFHLSMQTKHLVISLSHYSVEKMSYKITFNSFYSHLVSQENITDEKLDKVLRSEHFESQIVCEILNSEYMQYMLERSELKIFLYGEGTENLKQYRVYSANFIVDVLTDKPPVLEMLVMY